MRLVDNLQKQPKGNEVLFSDKLGVICLEVGDQEKYEMEAVTVFQKNITFINFSFSRMFFSFQIQQAEISHYLQAESAKFLIHFYSRKAILESSERKKNI